MSGSLGFAGEWRRSRRFRGYQDVRRQTSVGIGGRTQAGTGNEKEVDVDRGKAQQFACEIAGSRPPSALLLLLLLVPLLLALPARAFLV